MGYSNCSEAGRAELDEGARYYLTILSPWTLQSADGVPKPGELVPQDGISWECFVAFMERVGSPKSTFIDCCKGSFLPHRQLSSMADPIEDTFWDAVRYGVAELLSLLRDNPNLATYSQPSGSLHIAALHDQAEVVKLLLAHSDIDVNLEDGICQTPLSVACYQGSVSAVRALLRNPRVSLTYIDSFGYTPLWWAAREGHHKVIECLIASGRDMGDIDMKGPHHDGQEYTALEIARMCENTEVVSVLERFVANSFQTRHELRVKLRVAEELAADIFALTVFLCDDLLQLKPALARRPPYCCC